MKKNILCSFLVIVGLILGACSNETKTNNEPVKKETENSKVSTKNQEEKKVSNQLPIKSLGDLDVAIEDVKITESENGQKMVNISLVVTNQATIEGGVGAFEFVLKVDDKAYNVYENRENINSVIEPSQTVKGHLNFEVPNSSTKATLIYSVDEAKSVSWDISL